MIDEELKQEELTADPVSVSTSMSDLEPIPEPASIPEAEPDSIHTSVEVVSIDELLERLTSDDGEPVTDSEELQEPDAPVVEPDSGMLDVLNALSGLKGELVQISGQVAELQQTMKRPALITSFQDYTITETLLLLLFLAAFLAACVRMLKGGLKWLKS